jgi:shikimate dehydrogenase
VPAEQRRAAVLGTPIAHSLSPVLHRAAYAQLGLHWRYDAIEVGEAGLADFLAGCGPEWAGLSLTMPLKRAIVPLLDEASDLVRLVGAANTVVLGHRGAVGHNTDVAGIVDALRESGAQPGPALVIGGGATAASAVAALAVLGSPQVVVRARRPEAVGALRELAGALGLGLAVEGWPAPGERLPGRGRAGIVVSTVPAAAAADLVPAVPLDPGVLLDVAYDPWPPPLVTAWRAGVGVAVTGDAMLLHQAAAQVELMTGRRPDVEVMRAALRAEIERRAARS